MPIKVVKEPKKTASVSWKCRICKRSYGTKKGALKCESRPMEEKKFKIGETVKIKMPIECSEVGGYFSIRNGKVTKIEGPEIMDQDYSARWLHSELYDYHCFAYIVEFECPCGTKMRSMRLYSPEIEKIKESKNRKRFSKTIKEDDYEELA